MPAIQRSEFALALNQVAAERGVDASVVLDTVKNAILAAYRKDHPAVEIEEYTATLNQNTGEARISTKEKDVTPPGFGRIAAQTAKQVILQKIREKRKEAIVSDYRARIGTIINGMVLKFLGLNVVVDIGKTEALMPPSEQIPNEKYHLNQRLTVYILDIREGLKGEEVIVSRSNNGLLEGLFKREVPEVAQGAVVIKTIAREPGNRAKVAVASNQTGIDPVGSCVGQKGVRVQAMIFPGYSATSVYLLLSVVSILSGAKLATAILVMGVPMIDGLFTVIRRLASRPFAVLAWPTAFASSFVRTWTITTANRIVLLDCFCYIRGGPLTLSSKAKVFAIVMVAIIFGGALLFLHLALRLKNEKNSV